MNNLLRQHLSEIKILMHQYGVNTAYAFGSAVKDTMSEDSDVDFIISFPEEMDYTTYGENYFKLLYALQDLLKKEVDLVTERTIKNPYLLQSINEHKLQIV